MAPKRSGKTKSKVVVKATQKVVEETVKVTVLGSKQKPLREKITTTEKKKETYTTTAEEKGKIISEKDKEAPEELMEKEQITADDEEEETVKDLPAVTVVEEPPKKEEKKTAAARRSGRRRRKEGLGEGYKRYLYRVLKQVHPGMGISSKAMTVLNGFMNDMFERIANEATKLCRYTGRTTLSGREIQGAVRLVLPGELGKHAMSEGTKPVSTYLEYAVDAAAAAAGDRKH